jgi:starch-binding outer membrane protein, SusD/RagB family
MKSIILKVSGILLIITSIVYLACNKDVLNIPPPTQSENSFFKTESEFRTAMIGAYAALTEYYSSANSRSGGSAELTVWFLPGDDLTLNNPSAFETFDNDLNSSQGKLNEFFKSSYILIARVNKVMEKLELADASIFTTPNMRSYMQGEGLFLRGFSHFMLWNLFGTAPVDTIVVTSPSQFNIPSSEGVELLDQAIADLTHATSLLPTATWDANNVGRVTANSAWGLLGKVLVFRASATGSDADYQAAITAFNKISGVSLMPDFGANFRVNSENNNESLFEFQGGKNIIGQDQNTWLANDACDCGVAGSYYQMFYQGDGSYMSDGPWKPTTKLKNTFSDSDPRRYLTLDTPKNRVIKYIVGGDVKDGAVNSLNNHRILRYADVLLLKAEAILQSGGSTAEAIGLINQVRTRARNTPGGGGQPTDLSTTETNTATIMQWIMDERFRELAGEGHRWFDLRRWHMAGHITLNNAFFDSEQPGRMAFAENNLLFPIPSDETSRNPNIIQNEGY